MTAAARTIRCVYTCGECAAVGVEVDVTERDPGAQDVVAWFRQALTPALMDDHRRRSPLCRASKFAEVRVPIETEGGHVGVTPTKN